MDRPWIKLWIEMLSDPKVARLPDWLWRKFVEMLLLAGFENADGKLPPVDTIAWMLHLAPNKVEEALHELSEGVGVVHQETDGSWFVTKFSKRQAAPSKERTERWREREVRKERHSDASRDGHDDDDDSSSTSSSSSSDSYSLILRVYESEIGTLTKVISEDLQIALEKYPPDWITAAIQEAARNNARSWSYANAILKRWKTDGFQTRGGSKNGKAAEPEPYQNPFRRKES